MRRTNLLCSLAILVTLATVPRDASAKIDPMRLLTEGQLRADVVIAVDTSGSMTDDAAGNTIGGDCEGGDGSAVCGDGLCSGAETSGTCSSDCKSWSATFPWQDTSAGSYQKCVGTMAELGRLALVKRALRIVLPEFRQRARFSLITFKQKRSTSSGAPYFYYDQANTGTSATASHFYSEWELKDLGVWSSGPPASFTHGLAAMTLLAGTPPDSLYYQKSSPSNVTRIDYAGLTTTISSEAYVYLGSYYSFTTYARASSGAEQVSTTYQGPVIDVSGTTYVHRRYTNHVSGGFGMREGLTGDGSAAQLLVGIDTGASPDVQTVQDKVLGTIMRRLNYAEAGGLVAAGNTPLDTLVTLAGSHLDGLSDPAAACRPRLILLFNDGAQSSGSNIVSAAQALYTSHTSNPIRILPIAMPGAPTGPLDDSADYSDDGVLNSSASSESATDLNSTVQAIRTQLFSALKADITTSGAGVATGLNSGTPGNLSLVASTEYPGWQGHLRALDQSIPTCAATPSSCELWDATTLLNARVWSDRSIYTGRHDVSSGTLIPLQSAGVVNTAAIKTVWTGYPTPDSEIVSFIEWLVGKTRASAKVSGFMRVTPAVIGKPPARGTVPGHSSIELAQGNRQSLIYASSNDGILHAFDLQGKELFGYIPPHALTDVYNLWKAGGQDIDPANYKYIVASSPRVEDLAISKNDPWLTYLVQPSGPGKDAFYILDITDPTSCSDPNTPSTCTLTGNVKVVFNSPNLGTPPTLGNTWSLPAMFWRGGEKAQMAHGTGYGGTSPGETYYNFWFVDGDLPWAGSPTVNAHALSGLKVVDAGLIANSVAVLEPDGHRHVLATYQADLAGKIVRYDKADAGSGTALSLGTGTGVAQPFHYPPAAIHRQADDTVTLAFTSGSYLENKITIPTSGALTFPDATAFTSKVYMRTEKSNSVDSAADNFTCPINTICSASCYGGGSIVAGCTNPSQRALPTSQPLLVDNIAAGNAIEAFFAYFDPPTAVCSVGDSYVVRVRTNGNSQDLVSITKFTNTYVSGFAVVGGGSDIVVTKAGTGGAQASAATVSGSALGSGVAAPIIEGYREVE